MNKFSEVELKKIANKLRKKIIKISFKNKAHHIGSELSCIDILTALFHNYINLNKDDIFDSNSDVFIMSKGHAALAYYVLLAEKNFFSYNELEKNFLSNSGRLGGHPDYKAMNAVQVNSGSLGYGVSVGAGFALIAKKQNLNRKVYVLLGDGECNEGSIWESILFSSHHNLSNLIIMIDQNKLQGLGDTKSVMDMKSLKNKFESFGCDVFDINGHDFLQIDNTFQKSLNQNNNNMPKVIISSTIKGKGVKTMEGKLSSHYETLTSTRYDEVMKELS